MSSGYYPIRAIAPAAHAPSHQSGGGDQVGLAGLDGSGLTGIGSWSLVAVDTLAVAGNRYLVDASGGNIDVTLPATPSVGDAVGIDDAKSQAATNQIWARRNGNLIDGVADDLQLADAGTSIRLVFAGGTVGWRTTNLTAQ